MNKKVAGLVVAAGMSSRMRAFKPLLSLGNKTIIEHVVDNLIEGGIQEIVVVTGNKADEVERQLRNKRVHFVRNENYAKTTMFDSIKLGLQYIQNRCDKFFFLPGDIPLFRGYSIRAMEQEMESMKCQIVQPTYRGKHGHPVLFSAECIKHILHHDGTNGLKGAIENFLGIKVDLPLPDQGILMDADTQEDYRELNNYFLNIEKPTLEHCMEILKYFNTDERTQEHCISVAELAKEFAVKLLSSGYKLDVQIVEAGAILHDVARREKNHAVCGAKWVMDLGYPKIAEIIRAHMDLPQDAVATLDERSIVYLADKFYAGSQRVTLEERFERAFSRFGENKEAIRAVNIRLDNARKVLQKIEEKTAGIKYENSFGLPMLLKEF
jgi:molybdenum cofactor cytidylyltransferase